MIRITVEVLEDGTVAIAGPASVTTPGQLVEGDEAAAVFDAGNAPVDIELDVADWSDDVPDSTDGPRDHYPPTGAGAGLDAGSGPALEGFDA